MHIIETFSRLEHLLIQLVESKVLPDDSYLAGGTAVYFYFPHRISVDLDFFTQKPFMAEALLFKIRKLIKETKVEILEKDTLIAYLSPEIIKFSLFFLPYNLLSPLNSYVLKPGIVIDLASLDDIEAMKAIALVQRGSAKDFVDLYYLLKESGHSFEDLSLMVRKKYGLDKEYDYHLKKALVYFDDAELELEAIWLFGEKGRARKISAEDWEEIKDFFIRLCR